jgi:hypothetical protein
MDADKIPGLLAALGTTADEVAESLRARGIRGKPGDSEGCALARYLRSEGLGDVRVGLNKVYQTFPSGTAVAVADFWDTPVHEFRMQFDRHEHPDLVGDEEETR